MSNEDMSDLSSSSCSIRSKELKALLSEGGHGGRVEKNVCDDWDFVNKVAIDESENGDEKSESETFNVDDNIIINVDKLQKSISDAYCCKICTKNEMEKKFLKFIMYLENYEEEILQKSLKHTFTSEIMRYKWIEQNRISYSIHYMLFQGRQKVKDPFSKPVKFCVECNGIASKLTSICGNGCHSSELASPEVSSKATSSDVAFIRQPSTNFAMNTKLVMACQMSGGGLTLAETFLRFLDIKGSVKRFNYIERVVGEAERKSFEDAKDEALKEEMELTIKNNFNGKKPSGTIPLTISYGKKNNK